jgi:hypothetical protein
VRSSHLAFFAARRCVDTQSDFSTSRCHRGHQTTKFLIALDETRHFGQAAARCHITQPTLSMRLRNLEDELDLVLVNRGQRFEGFTEAGERVLAWARTLLAAHDGLFAEPQRAAGNWSAACAWAWCR